MHIENARSTDDLCCDSESSKRSLVGVIEEEEDMAFRCWFGLPRS
ncbi:unnamed protein product, partial [Allacma fusca]